MTNEERIKYYMGDFYDKKLIIKRSSIEKYKEFKMQSLVHCTDKVKNHYPQTRGWWGSTENEEFTLNIECLSPATVDLGYFLIRVYNKEMYDLPILSISRNIGDKLMLVKYYLMRYWKGISQKYFDLSWRNKKNDVVWRGVNSGIKFLKKPNRQDLINKYFNKYNIGFSPNVNEKDPNYVKYVKDSLSIQEQTSYKYIVCMEGNEVATSLHWNLTSGSVILMPKVTQESWLMQGLLKEWVHYVPLSDDLDIEEKVNWCEENQDHCEEIVQNAMNFMLQFFDEKRELEIHNEIIHRYKENFIFVD